jgi:hypothetical protein
MTEKPELRYTLGFATIGILGILIGSNFIWLIVSLIQDKIKKKYYQSIIDEKRKVWTKK